MNLILIGYRGAGKTTVAQRLALALGWEWADSDAQIELRAGKSIATIFADDGEQAFRDLESRAIAELAARRPVVLAVGGGAVLRPENRERLKQSGLLVWLAATPETILARVAADAATASRRPNLTTAGGEAEVRQLAAQREPLYRACADLVVATDGKTPTEVAAEIVRRANLPLTPEVTA